VAVDPIGDDNPIEEILLTGFPNPERIGCPPSETIEALGQKRIPKGDPAWDHIWHCSPCYKEFKIIRDKRLAAIEEKQKKASNRRRASVYAAVAVACACLFGFLFFSTGLRSFRRSTVVRVDLSDAGTYRGGAGDDSPVLATLPRKLDELHITLPRLSPPGRYVFAILKSRSESAAIALGSATATGNQARVTLVVTLDLSAAAPGRYYLATRLEEQGQEQAAYYYPVLIAGG
jgi:hypothetical protein